MESSPLPQRSCTSSSDTEIGAGTFFSCSHVEKDGKIPPIFFLIHRMERIFFSFRCLHGVLCITLCTLMDHSVKNLVQRWLVTDHGMVITPFFSVVKKWNMGVGWGLFPASSWHGRVCLSAVAIIFVGILWHWYEKSYTSFQKNGLILVMGGGISNTLDRILHGGVFDFLDLHYGPHHFHTFNIADILISIGFFFLLADLWIWKKNTFFSKK